MIVTLHRVMHERGAVVPPRTAGGAGIGLEDAPRVLAPSEIPRRQHVEAGAAVEEDPRGPGP